MAKRSLFGTDGIRGRANVFPMTCEVALALGRAVTHYFQSKKENKIPLIIIGKDTRLSCYTIEQAFASGVCSQGGQAILTGPLPTPGVAFVTQSMRADAGVMISASHNYYYDNGIKIFDEKGLKLPDEIEAKLEYLVLNPEQIPLKVDQDLGRARRLEEVYGRYIVFAKSVFNPSYGLEDMRIVLDCANGAGYKVAPMIFEELGAEVINLGINPNGKNINEDCGVMHPENCALEVQRFRADLGICLDGDADRVLFIDGKGKVIHGDRILGIFAKFFKDQGLLRPGDEIVGTIMSNLGLELYLKEKLGLTFYRTNVGDRYILDRIRESGSLLGGEPSGHVVFSLWATTGDGIISGLKAIEAMKYYGLGLSELANEIELFPQKMVNIPVKSRPPLETIPELQKALKEQEAKLGNTGRIVLRYSGTEPKLRLMVEAHDNDVVDQTISELTEVIQCIQW